MKKSYIFVASKGGLAQLARAFDWQSKGHRFDSDILHLIIKELQALKFVTLFLYIQLYIQTKKKKNLTKDIKNKYHSLVKVIFEMFGV